MKFSLLTVLWVFALLASAMATFGEIGTACAMLVLSVWGFIFYLNHRFAGPVFLIATLVLLGGVPMLRPEPLRGPSARNSCLNNLKQIPLAIQGYEESRGILPPAYTSDENGKPLHSWRVLLLPHIEYQNLYNAIQLGEPWDSPHNRKLWDKMPGIYRCPGCEAACELGLLPDANHSTSYFAVVGPETVRPENFSIKLKEVSDGGAKTLLLTEAYKPDSCWMEPKDLSTEEVIELLCTKKSPGHLHTEEGFLSNSVSSQQSNLGFLDGSIYSSNDLVDEIHVRSLLTRNGNENKQPEFSARRFQSTGVHRLAVVYHWKRIYTFTLFTLLSLLPLAKLRRRHVLTEFVG